MGFKSIKHEIWALVSLIGSCGFFVAYTFHDTNQSLFNYSIYWLVNAVYWNTNRD